MGRIKAVIFDYGAVISTPQPKKEIRAMEKLAGVDRERFWEAYWRVPAGLRYGPYYGGVLAEGLCSLRGGLAWDLLRQLADHDARSWTVLDRPMLVFVRLLKTFGFQGGPSLQYA